MYTDRVLGASYVGIKMEGMDLLRNRLILVGATLVAGGALSACGLSSPTVNNSPAAVTSGQPVNAKSSAAAAATVGSTVDLTGMDKGEKIAVTLVRVMPRAHGADQFTTPDAGNRFMAVQIKLSNVGTAAYSDSPSNGAKVTDSQGQSYEADINDVAGCIGFPGTETIAAGSAGLGCIVFQVPKTAHIVQFQIALDSGFADDTGQWNF